MPSPTANEFFYEISTATSTRSRWCKLRPTLRNRVCKCAFAVWPLSDVNRRDWNVTADELVQHTVNYYKQVYGNPLVVWILLAIAKIVIETLLEWWLNRSNVRAAVVECSHVCHTAGMHLDSCFSLH